MKINEKHLVAFVNSNAPIEKEGYLLKKGEVNKSFQKRWFVLKGNLFFYFDKRGDREPIGVIVLESCTVELGDNSELFAFDLVFQGANCRTYTLAAETQEEMEVWMKAITCAGYEYRRLMVNELQRQLDDLNTADRIPVRRSNAARGATGGEAVLSSEITKSVLRNSDQLKGGLVDLSLPSSNTVQVKQEKRIGRINPFDTDAPKSSSTFFAPTVEADLVESGMDALDLNFRDFENMHQDFGGYIKEVCSLHTNSSDSLI